MDALIDATTFAVLFFLPLLPSPSSLPTFLLLLLLRKNVGASGGRVETFERSRSSLSGGEN